MICLLNKNIISFTKKWPLINYELDKKFATITAAKIEAKAIKPDKQIEDAFF